MYNGQGCNLGKLTVASSAKTYSISAENVTGEKGAGGMALDGTGANAARELGQGWKVSPSIILPAGAEYTIADIDGEGIIKHIWMTLSPRLFRMVLLKIYWDGEETPAVCTPIGDFFCNGWNDAESVNSLAVTVNTNGGLNCYFEMPFRKHARFVVENLHTAPMTMFYQIDFIRTEIDPDSLYFHALWNRVHSVPYKEVYTILDTTAGRGHYVGTYMAWHTHYNGWWGEGEIKFYIDGDKDFPSICGTGTEDYFGGAWCYVIDGKYVPYSTAYQGFDLARKPDGFYRAEPRFSLYRWHIVDPITFTEDLRVTIQALGWRGGGPYLPLQDDLASVAYWYSDRADGVDSWSFTARDLQFN